MSARPTDPPLAPLVAKTLCWPQGVFSAVAALPGRVVSEDFWSRARASTVHHAARAPPPAAPIRIIGITFAVTVLVDLDGADDSAIGRPQAQSMASDQLV